jgi:hypothetical protein
MSLWPNPANDQLELSWPSTLASDITWDLVDLNGRRVMSGRVARGAQRAHIALPSLAEGMYVITTMTDGTHNSQRVIISR